MRTASPIAPRLVLALFASACGETDSGADPVPNDGGTMDGGFESEPPTFDPTFSAIYREIIRVESCTLGLCHGDGGNAGDLLLVPRAVAYQNLVTTNTTGVDCAVSGLSRVEPYEPERSLFYLKFLRSPPCGSTMPPDRFLSAEQVNQVNRWIELGAHDD